MGEHAIEEITIFQKANLIKLSTLTKGYVHLIKGLGHEKLCYILSIHLTKMTFSTKCQVENLIKMDKCSSNWPWLNQISHIEWIWLSQIDHPDLTLNQMNFIHLMT